MGGCSPNIVSQLLKSYSQNTLMNYALSFIGSKLLGDKFGALKNQITSKFNLFNFPNFQDKMFSFDKIIKDVTGIEQNQMSKMNQLKPYIRELDDGPPEKKNQFMDVINKQFPKQIKDFKDNLIKGLGDKLNPMTYLKGFTGF